VAAETRSVSAEDIQDFRHAGWSDVAIHHALPVIAYFNYINRIASAVGIDDESDSSARG